MEIKLNTLKIINYDSNNEIHRKAKYEILRDDNFKKYFGDFFIKDSDLYFQDSNSLETKKIYWVTDQNNIVGMVRIFSYHQLGYVNIQYAVLPNYRNLGYGKRILQEFSSYLMSQENVVCVEGEIDKNNAGSIKIATQIGYEQENNKYRFRK